MGGDREISAALCVAFSLTLCVVLLVFVVMAMFFSRWLKCFLAGSPVSIIYLIGMRLRGTPIALVTDAYIALIHSGAKVTIRQVESTYLANRPRVFVAGDLVEIVKRDLPSPSPSPQP